jgi:asparagine synthase (glutamine-hydrolysing)
MCGICGIYSYRNDEPVDPGLLGRINDLLTHRGPDDSGSHVDGPLGIAMRRLIIIDPESGHQPLYNENRSIAVICNGEIYNFPRLRGYLEAKGHKFSSRSDCEVIVHLYEEEGAACVEKLQGMFALAVWDEKNKKLFVARDRLGIKPLYYTDQKGMLVFASELKSILAHPAVSRRLSHEGLHHYLSLNYVPAPFTLVENVHQLLPGQYLVCSPEGIELHSYWDLRFDEDHSLDERKWADEVADKLRSCVESHLVSDVPFGAFLSGGIDSSAVTAYMADILDGPVSTFSIDFKEKSFSEARYARMIAERFACDHHEIEVSPDVVSLLETLIWHADDPLADSSMIPVYLLAKFARESVTMVLTGDGGDEVFAGYDTYNAYYVRKMYRRLPAWFRRHIVKKAVDALPVSLTKVSFDFKAKRFVEGAELDAEEAHFWWRVIFSETAKSRLYSDDVRERLAPVRTPELYKHYFAASGTDDPLNRMLYVDTRFYLPADMLAKVDRMTMANALEARVPFLDHELVELAARIPSSMKFKKRIKKYILKKALEGVLPSDVLYRRKAGFNVPVNVWLAGELNRLAREVLSRERLGATGLFDMDFVDTMLAEHQNRKRDHGYALWGLMCFQVWYEMFIAAPRVTPPEAVRKRWGL